MGTVADGWREYRDRLSVQDYGDIAFGQLVETAALLKGKADASGTGWERPPMKLSLWLDGKLIRFCFSNNDFPLALWGSTKALDAGLLGVEEALCREHCDWRKNKWHKNGFTHSTR